MALVQDICASSQTPHKATIITTFPQAVCNEIGEHLYRKINQALSLGTRYQDTRPHSQDHVPPVGRMRQVLERYSANDTPLLSAAFMPLKFQAIGDGEV